MPSVFRIRTDDEVFLLEADLLGDGVLLFLLHDASTVAGIVTECGEGTATLLTADGSWIVLRYHQIIEVKPLPPGEEYEAVVNAMEKAGLIVE